MDSRGAPVEGDRLRRIDELVIPPAWRDVWISPSPNAKLQATGIDAAGRRQYLYHPDYRAAREREKYDRLVHFGELLPGLRRTLDRHLELGPYEREWACAVAVTLVNRGWFRVGSERHLRTSRTYGITTLSKRHVTVRGRQIGFRFPGKHRIAVRTTVVDPDIAEAVRELLRYEGGARLLRFDREGEPANLTARLLNDYLGEHLGEGFTAKDFRTWGGTLSAARGLADRGLAETAAEERRILAAVMRRVGEELGNTPAVARSSYVSPAVVEQWRDGRTLDDFARRRKRGLSADETALLALLRSWRIRRARGEPAR